MGRTMRVRVVFGVVAVGLAWVVPGEGQEPPPGLGFELERLESFEAEYDRAGRPFRVRLTPEVRSEPDGEWSFSVEYDGVARVHAIDFTARAAAGPFDAWSVGLLPLESDAALSVPLWSSATPEGPPTIGALTVANRSEYRVDRSESVRPWVVEAEHEGGVLRFWVVPHAPYLVRQDFVDASGVVTHLLELRSMRRLDGRSSFRSIHQASRAFSQAYMRGDGDALRALYTEDAVLIPPGGLVEGRDAIGRYFAPNPRRTTLAHRMTSASLQIDGDRATDRGRWHQLVRNEADGALSRASEQYLVVWKRGMDGAWRIAWDMWHRPSPDEAAAPIWVLGREAAAGPQLERRIPIARGAVDTEQGNGVIGGADDLSITLTGHWDDAALNLELVWEDDVLDTSSVRADAAMWVGPDGRRRDRMYYFDHVNLRFWLGDRFVGAWLSPRVGLASQWAYVDIPGEERRPLDVVARGEASPRGVVLRLSVPWELLGLRPEDGTALDVEVVATDMDAPGRPLEDKTALVDWLSWRAPLVLEGS